jgi:hypothetical protein
MSLAPDAQAPAALPRRGPFLAGVCLIAFSVLVFQVVQTRVLSVIAWYYLAFFAISVAMLGMTVGAVWVYLSRERFDPDRMSTMLVRFSLMSAFTMPASLLVQFTLITTFAPSLTTVVAWTLLLAAMAVPYVFAGIVVSVALTRSPFPVNQVYGVDLIGAALGCAVVVLVLDVLDGPSTIVLAGAVAALAAAAFAAGAPADERAALRTQRLWLRPLPVAVALTVLAGINAAVPFGIRPIMVKDQLETQTLNRYEKWNSYSRITASPPTRGGPGLWAPAPVIPAGIDVPKVGLVIDGAAATLMPRYDGTRESIDYLRYDLVTLAYHLPGIRRAAVIGVGGGRDILTAHLFGVPHIVGVELNPIFVELLTRHPDYAPFSNVRALPDLRIYVDDARSWFASTPERFDLIQMSMIDTWAATGAGAFSLSENGLYTLEGWRAFLGRLEEKGIFTVSRWYRPGDSSEAARMVGLATAAVLDLGVADARPHLFIANENRVATLVLSRSPFTPEQIGKLREETERLGFQVMLAPDQPPKSELLRGIVAAKSLAEIDAFAIGSRLDLTVPTDKRPFFFNQLRFRDVPNVGLQLLRGQLSVGVIYGNLLASIALLLILGISIVAVLCTIVVPLAGAARQASTAFIAAGSSYFALIGLGFMLCEIAMLQYFGIYLGHPIYSLSVCLFSLILATGIGSLVSGRIAMDRLRNFAIWSVAVGVYLVLLQWKLSDLFEATTAQPLPVRIGVALAIVMPLGFLLGFAFPTGMRLVEAIDRRPTAWFWGINGATGVLASVLAVMIGIAWGIDVTILASAVCYLALIPVARQLIGQRPAA